MRDPFLLTAASVLALAATPALAQDAAQPQSTDADAAADDDAYADDEGAIVVTAPRGSIAGDIVPEDVLDARDIQATGATSIDELLEALAPQLGSARGGGRGEGSGRPIILIEGQRISSFREMRDLPPEAIERVDILPEEAALQFGYSPDQKVINFVLRERFNSTAVELEGTGATRGGRLGSEIELDKFLIADGKRTSVGFEFENWGALDETERDVLLRPVDTYPDPIDSRPYRTLLPATESYQLNASHKRSLGEKGLTVTLGLEQQNSRSRFGAPVATFDIPAGSIYADPTAETDSILRLVPGDALGRTSRNRTAELATALTGGGAWSWSITTQATLSDSRSRTGRGPDTDAFQAGLDGLDPAFDPYGALPDFAFYPRDEARSDSLRLQADGLLNGIVGDTAAGPITLSLRALATHSNLHSEGTANGVAFAETDLKRSSGLGRANLDVPLLDRDSGVGSLSINANGTVETLSDFGELYSVGGGFNWRPTRKLSLLGSFGREENAPSLSQLGAARVVDPLTSFFDFTTGETVFVTATTGGNPNLLAERRDVTKLSAQWELPTSDDIDLRAEYVRERITNPASSFPAATPIIEGAFPGRFTRDDDGTLVAVDLTPVNYDSQARDQFKWGLSWSKEIEAKPPSEETREKMRARFAETRARRQQQSGTPPQGEGPPALEGQEGAPPKPEGEQQAQSSENRSDGQAQRGGGRRGGGGMFGRGGRGGRLGINAFHTVTFKDEVTIADGVPLLDYLDGEAASRFGGTPRHTVELQGFRYNNGLGIRLSADWRSATSIDGAAGPIRFSDYADVDVRLWYNLAEKPEVLVDHPWMRGMRVRLAVDNLFDSRPKVTGPEGEIPFTYQPAYLEPQGRTVSISLRKLFVPRGFGDGRGG